MDYSSYKCIRVERDGKVLRLTLNRPDVLNAVDEELHNELARIFYDVALDHEAKVVVLTGEGRAFSAGGDVELMQRGIDNPDRSKKGFVEGKRIVFSLLEIEKPVICRLNGDAIGLGATLALLCDMVIAVDSARIGDPHVRVGLVAGDGGAVIWPQLIGFVKAKEYLLTGDLIPAPEAAQMGLINRAVPADQLDVEVEKLVGKLANGASAAINWTKAAVNIPLRRIAHEVMDAGFGYEGLSIRTEDHQEAVNAFRDKRKPEFKGK